MKTHFLLSIAAAASVAIPVFADDQASSSDQASSRQGGSQQQKSQSRSSSKSSPVTKVSLNELPQKVQKTFRSEAGNVNLDSLNKLSKNGQTCYVGTFDKNGMKGQLTVGEDGSVLQVVQTANIALIYQAPPLGKSDLKQSELPESVQFTLKRYAGTNQVGEIAKVDHAGQTLYTAAYNDAGVHTELIFDQSGKLVLRTEQTALMAAPLQSAQAVTMQTAPKAVQDAIRQHTGGNPQVSDIDKGQWRGQTAYRVMIQKNGSARPLLVSESGEILRGARSESSVGGAGTSQQGQSQRNPNQSRDQRSGSDNQNSRSDQK